MAARILAIGQRGAEMARACLMQSIPGEFASADVVLMAAAREDGERMEKLYAQYDRVHRHTGSQPGMFSAAMTITCWPRTESRFSIAEQMRTPEDRLLCRALFTQEQATLAPQHALDGSGNVAAMTWAGLLTPGDPVLDQLVRDLKDGTPCVMMAGLCDPAGACGVAALTEFLQREAGTVPAAVLELPVHHGDDAGLCRDALLSGRLEPLKDRLFLVGMPEDCRRSREGAHLADWLCCRAALRLLKGSRGAFTWRVPAENLHWAAFGNEASAMEESCAALLRLSALTVTATGPQLEAALESPNALRDRLHAWYHTYFSDVKQLSEEERLSWLEAARDFRELLQAWCGWMHQVLDNLPPLLRWADALESARQEASEHYEEVLTAAGRLAWQIFDAEKNGLAQETFVHRYDMADSEAEAAMKQIEELRDRLSASLAEQEALFRKLGGRMTRTVLQQIYDREEKQASDLRAQAEEAKRRIDHAAEIATVEESGKVATARIRLTRMERHVALLNGRATRARRDLASWSKEDRRVLMPTLEGGDEHAGLLLPDELLRALAENDGKQAAELWPWPEQTAKQLLDSINRGGQAQAPDALGRFIRSSWSACKG